MRVERMIIAVVVAVLAMIAVGSTAVASADPDMTYNSVGMTYN
jgi:Tfp pilus assembly protein PilE